VTEDVAIVAMIARAERLGMSVLAYAIHTGQLATVRHTVAYRALFENGFALEILGRRIGARWRLLSPLE